MVNTKPRRKSHPAAPSRKRPKHNDPAPWTKGDPTRMYGLNTPVSEPLMLMLDWLVENRAIFSKASFIREVVSKAAEAEIARLRRVRAAVKQLDADDRRRR